MSVTRHTMLQLVATAIGLIHGLIADGAQLQTHSDGEAMVRTCRIDLRHDRLRMFWKDREGVALGTFERLASYLRDQGEELVCATNGGIYQQDLRPLGLYVEESRVLHRLNIRRGAYGNFYFEPNGVFLVEKEHARIVDTATFEREFTSPEAVQFATQSGPMLLQNGQVNPRFAPNSQNRLTRSAVCIVSPQEVVLAVTETPISFRDFAVLLQQRLKCTDALHLDSSISRLFPGERLGLSPAYSVIIAATQPMETPARR